VAKELRKPAARPEEQSLDARGAQAEDARNLVV
jgi:hypothetical protein